MVMLVGASIGWAAACCSILANGSFGVPIKSETCRRLDVDPLVFQTYKTVMCLLFSFASVWALGIPIVFTPWGIVSGLVWVPGGIATVAAIKLLGLSLAVAVGNSLIALVSFTWGIFIFEEKVKSRPMACLAILLMIVGFTGMSFFSSASQSQTDEPVSKALRCLQEPLLDSSGKKDRLAEIKKLKDAGSDDDTVSETDSDSVVSGHSLEDSIKSSTKQAGNTSPRSMMSTKSAGNTSPRSMMSTKSAGNTSPGSMMRNRKSIFQEHSNASSWMFTLSEALPLHSTTISLAPSKNTVMVCGREVSRFKAGLVIQTLSGLWGGSVMIPMKMCDQNLSGPGYLVSFSLGATIVNLALWWLRFSFHVGCTRSVVSGYKALPPFHLKEMWLLGGTSGFLWSTGNFFSTVSVHHLGAGVGYSVVQSSMLVGGMWGIFYFGEVSGKAMIAKWFAAALTTIAGIVLLAYQHAD